MLYEVINQFSTALSTPAAPSMHAHSHICHGRIAQHLFAGQWLIFYQPTQAFWERRTWSNQPGRAQRWVSDLTLKVSRCRKDYQKNSFRCLPAPSLAFSAAGVCEQGAADVISSSFPTLPTLSTVFQLQPVPDAMRQVGGSQRENQKSPFWRYQTSYTLGGKTLADPSPLPICSMEVTGRGSGAWDLIIIIVLNAELKLFRARGASGSRQASKIIFGLQTLWQRDGINRQTSQNPSESTSHRAGLSPSVCNFTSRQLPLLFRPWQTHCFSTRKKIRISRDHKPAQPN